VADSDVKSDPTGKIGQRQRDKGHVTAGDAQRDVEVKVKGCRENGLSMPQGIYATGSQQAIGVKESASAEERKTV